MWDTTLSRFWFHNEGAPPRRAVDRLVRRLSVRRAPDLERLEVDPLVGDVLGQLDVGRAGLLQTREAEGFAHDLGRRVRDVDPRAPLRDRSEHADDIDVLVRF